MNGCVWSLRIRREAQELRIYDSFGFPPHFKDVAKAINTLVLGQDHDIRENCAKATKPSRVSRP